jgi:hypothetical protein
VTTRFASRETDANRGGRVERRARLETQKKIQNPKIKKQPRASDGEPKRADAAKTPTNRRRARSHRVPGGYGPGPRRDGVGTVRALSHT